MLKEKRRLFLIVIAIGLLAAVAAHFLFSVQKKPAVTEQAFPYSVTYKLDGETKTISGVYTCRFTGFSDNGISPLERHYDGFWQVDGVDMEDCTYKIAEKDGVELFIVTQFDRDYLMGDAAHISYDMYNAPALEAIDREGYAYDEAAQLDTFGAEIVSWEYPEPIENSLIFHGFAGLSTDSMIAMSVVGLLTLVACLIFVKKDPAVTYKVLDYIGIVLNFGIIFIALPIIGLAGAMIQMFPTGADWIYQADLCVPVITAFAVAASVSLRRLGFSKSGFFIQFLGPAALVILSIFEYVT